MGVEMSLRLKTVYNALVGAWGGLLAWFLLDLIVERLFRVRLMNVWLDASLNGAMVGMCIGALVGGFGGLAAARFLMLARGLIVGLITGVIGGVFGLLAGQVAFQFGGILSADGLVRGVFRALGWAIFGAGIGVAEGMLTLSFKRFLFGGLGGVIGGFVGGIAFALIERALNLQLLNRALGFALLGAFIGLFVGLIPDLLKDAWLKVVSSGRNEGKEFLLDKKINTIGRAERSDVALFGDKAIAPKHAEIRQESGRFVMHALAEHRVEVNDRQVTRVALQDGARVRVGATKLIFRRKR